MPLLLIFLILLVLPTELFSQDSLAGRWAFEEDNTTVEFYQKNDAFFGKLVASDNPNAPIGTDVFREFVLKNGKWKGKIYSIKRNKVLNAKLTQFEEEMKVTASFGFLRKTLVWKRVEPLPPVEEEEAITEDPND